MKRIFNPLFAMLMSILLGGANSASASNSCNVLFHGSLQFQSDLKASVTSDFESRDRLHETEIAPAERSSCCGEWGPHPLLYPPVEIPKQYPNARWQRDRIVAVAEKYIGLPYLHRHIPGMGGLDCSNFTSWVFNYGLGIGINSNVERQAITAGRRLSEGDRFEAGDLLFIYNEERSRIVHVVIYINENEIIDSTGPGVKIRKFSGWYKDRLAWARRLIEQ